MLVPIMFFKSVVFQRCLKSGLCGKELSSISQGQAEPMSLAFLV